MPPFVYSDSILLTLLSHFFPIILFDFHISFFPTVASPLPASCPIGLCVNRARMMFAAVISPTAFHFGMVICFALWFLRPTSILPFPQFWYPIRSGHGNIIQISCNWLDNYIHAFWMDNQVHDILYHSGHKWQNYDLPHTVTFTLYPFEIILGNIKALPSIPFWN